MSDPLDLCTPEAIVEAKAAGVFDGDPYAMDRQFVRDLHATNPAVASAYVDSRNTDARSPYDKAQGAAVSEELDLSRHRALYRAVDLRDGTTR